MPKKIRTFNYIELMQAISCAKNPQGVAGVLILAFDSWRKKVISNYSMSAILQAASDTVIGFGG